MAGKGNRNRRRRRRGRFGILYKLLSFLLIFSALLAGSVIFFRVNEITVVGNSRYTAEQIIAASKVELGDNLFLINKPQTARAITKALPYVEKVSPVKALPDRLELYVTESVAVAYWQDGEGYWLVNSAAKVVERTEEPSKIEGLPRMMGLTTVHPVLGTQLTAELEEQLRLDGVRELLSALDARGMAGEVTEFLDMSNSNVIYFGYGTNLTVAVPVSGNFERLAYSLEGVLKTCAEQGVLVSGTLDLTYGDKTAHLLTDRWLPEALAPVESEPIPETEPVEEGESEGEEPPIEESTP